MRTTILSVFLCLASIIAYPQTSYDILFSSSEHDEVGLFVLNDQFNNEQILSMYYECNLWDTVTPCTIRQFIYRIGISGDTIRWPFNDVRGDTTFMIEKIIKDPEGNYLWIGYGYDDYVGNRKKAFDYFAKWDSNYELIWETTHQRPSEFDPYMTTLCTHVLPLQNGNYLVGTSVTTVTTIENIEYYLMEVDFLNGNVLKEKIHNLWGYCYLMGLTYGFDSSEIMLHSASIYMNECNRSTPGIVYLDTETYDTIRTYCYNRDDDDPEKYWCVHLPYNAALYDNNTLIVAGTGDCTDLYGTDWPQHLFIYKYDSTMNLVERRFLTDQDTVIDAAWIDNLDINDNNEILVVGNHNRQTGTYVSKYDYIYVAKLDVNLQLIAERYIGGDAYYTAWSMAATNDGGVVITGTRYDYLVNDSEFDAFIIKTTGDLWVSQHENSNIPIHAAIVYPNPGDDNFTIRTTEYPSVLEIYNSTGVLVIVNKIDRLITQINTSQYKTGLYNWILKQDNRIIDSGKWIKSNK